MLVAGVCGVAAPDAGAASAAARCGTSGGAQRLEVTRTDCRTGRLLTRAYFRRSAPCRRACVVTVRRRAWRCREVTLTRQADLFTARVSCRRASDGATATWRYSGGGD